MRVLVLSALSAATIVAGLAASQPAEAKCGWHDWQWVCDHRGDRVDRDRYDHDRYMSDRQDYWRDRDDWRWRRDRDYYSGGGWRDRDVRYNWDRGY